jgi:hypothetical protein
MPRRTSRDWLREVKDLVSSLSRGRDLHTAPSQPETQELLCPTRRPAATPAEASPARGSWSISVTVDASFPNRDSGSYLLPAIADIGSLQPLRGIFAFANVWPNPRSESVTFKLNENWTKGWECARLFHRRPINGVGHNPKDRMESGRETSAAEFAEQSSGSREAQPHDH